MMTFLFLSWRDIRSPKSGGAEVHTHGLMKCFVKAGCRIVHFSPKYEGLVDEEMIEGIKYIRRGGVFSVIAYADRYYKKNKDKINYVVDQCNTHRFFTKYWVPQSKRIFYIHQLTREIWDINMRFPLSWIGKHAENCMLRLQRNDRTIALSESTKRDLVEVGFDSGLITVIPVAIDGRILGTCLDSPEGKKQQDFIYVGRYSKYKGIDAAIEALGIVRKQYKNAKLRILGKKDDEIIHTVIAPMAKRYGFVYGEDDRSDVILHGFVSEEEKFQRMKESRALLFPSLREGWGIIVTEAAALGTPSIVYDSPGCRDAVDYGKAGYLCSENTPQELARLMMCSIRDEAEYEKKRESAYDFAQHFSWEENQKRVEEFLRAMMMKA